jgi:hypothetical protein
MSTPPDPRLPALLLAAAAKLRFVVKVKDPAFGELGLLSDGQAERPLYITSAGGDRAAWTLEPGPRLDPHLMARATYDVLAAGALREDGAIEYQGKAYRLHWRWSASGMVAETFAMESTTT